MNKILLVAKRELGTYFSTWMAYVIAFAVLLINGLLFNAFAIGDKAKYSADVLRDFFYFSSGIGMVSGVFLSMRLLAEEKQTGTIVLFFTSPITERQLIYGKYLSAFIFLCLLQFATLYIPGLIFLEGKVSIGHIVAGYVGVILISSSVLAISLFASVISPNQMVAGVVGAAITVVFLVLWIVASRVDQPFRDLLSYMAIHNKRFTPFSRGIVHTRDVVFYLSLVVFFVECSVRALQVRRIQG